MQKKLLYFFLVWLVFMSGYAIINYVLSLEQGIKHILNGSVMTAFGIYNLYFLISIGMAKKSKTLLVIFILFPILPILLIGSMMILEEFVEGKVLNIVPVGIVVIFIFAFLIQFGLIFRLLRKKAG